MDKEIARQHLDLNQNAVWGPKEIARQYVDQYHHVEDSSVIATFEAVSDDTATTQEEPGVLVRQYGLGDPVDWGDDCHQHLWLCNKLWNRFVEIEQENRQKYFVVFRQDGELRAAEDEILALQTERSERIAQRNTVRAKARTKTVDSAETRDEINRLNRRITDLAKQVSTRRRLLRPAYGEQIRALELERRALVKQARQESGLWWSNYNLIQAKYEKARSMAMKEGFTTRAQRGPAASNSSQTVCAVDIGWRKVTQGLRVATTLDSTGAVQHVILPNSLLHKFEHVNTLKGQIDDELNVVQASLRDKVASIEELPEDLAEQLASVLRPHLTTRRLAKLSLFWRDTYPGIGAEIVASLEEHCKHLKRLQNEMDNLRDKSIRRRQDFYRNAAIRVVQDRAMVLIEDFDLRGVARRQHEDGSDDDTPEAVRRMRQVASVSELRKWIVLQAEKHGARVETRKAAFTTRCCSACGHLNEKSDPYDLVWKCQQCGNILDQDINACRNLLADFSLEPSANP